MKYAKRKEVMPDETDYCAGLGGFKQRFARCEALQESSCGSGEEIYLDGIVEVLETGALGATTKVLYSCFYQTTSSTK